MWHHLQLVHNQRRNVIDLVTQRFTEGRQLLLITTRAFAYDLNNRIIEILQRARQFVPLRSGILGGHLTTISDFISYRTLDSFHAVLQSVEAAGDVNRVLWLTGPSKEHEEN